MDDTVATRVEPGFDQVYFSASDGLKLAARDYGRGRDGTDEHATVVCLPGLTRNSADFHDLALILSRSEAAPRRVVSFDYRGRGLSDWDKDKSNYNIQVETDDVLALRPALTMSQHSANIYTLPSDPGATIGNNMYRGYQPVHAGGDPLRIYALKGDIGLVDANAYQSLRLLSPRPVHIEAGGTSSTCSSASPIMTLAISAW